MNPAVRRGRDIIARHGETVFNAARRLQGEAAHTPLTRAGFAQADAIGRALRASLGPRPPLDMWASPTGRALQTLAVIAEHLDLDWHAARTDTRLAEMNMGRWGGRLYADLAAERGGSIVRPDGALIPSPDGEDYPAVARRVTGWLADTEGAGDRLVIMHGVSSRVLRGVMIDRMPDPEFGAPIGPALPQGTAVLVEGGCEQVIHAGKGGTLA